MKQRTISNEKETNVFVSILCKENRKIILLLEPKTRVVRMYHQLWMDYLFSLNINCVHFIYDKLI